MMQIIGTIQCGHSRVCRVSRSSQDRSVVSLVFEDATGKGVPAMQFEGESLKALVALLTAK